MKVDYLKSLLRNAGDEADRIQQLRKLIVALAVSGNLGVNKRSHDLPSVNPDALPAYFEQMGGFTVLGAVARIEKGRTGIKQAVPGEYPLVVTAAERSPCDHFDFEGPAAIVPLVSSTGHGKASLHRLHYQEGKFALGTILAAIFPSDASLMSARFIFEYLSAFKEELLVSRMIGTANVSLSVGKIAEVPIPLVSLDAQAKVDELMALCDQLEEARTEREATRDRLAMASLARLNTPDPETFDADARFSLDALPALTTRADQIKQLRQTILNLVVRGKLVHQSRDDGSATEFLARIRTERQQLIAHRLLRQERPLSPIEESELLFQVPESWCWSRIGDAVLFTQYGTSEKAFPASNGVAVLAMGNIQDGKVVWANEKRIPHTSSELPDLYLKKYDLLYNRTNSAELVGKTGIYLGDDDELTFASYLIRLRPSIKWMNPRYLNAWMNSSLFRSTQIVPLIKKQTGQANVNGTALKNMLVPLPPLAEQHRIVAKTEELMTLCDQLEASLVSADDSRRLLLDALLAEALQPALQAAA